MKPLRLASTNAVAFSPDGRLLATDDDRYDYIWDIALRQKIAKFRPFSWAGKPAFSPDGTKLALKNTSGRICVVEVPSGKVLSDLDNESDGEGCRVLWSSDGRCLIDGSWEGFLRVRDWTSGEIVFEHRYLNEQIEDISSTADGHRWLVAHAPKWRAGMPTDQPLPPGYLSVWSWPLGTGAEEALPFRMNAQFEGTALSPDGSRIAILHDEAGEPRLSVVRIGEAQAKSVSLGEGSRVRSVAWSPDGRFVVAAVTERAVDPDAPPRRPDAKPWDFSGYQFSDTAVAWDSRTLDDVWRRGLEFGASGFAFSPDGAMLAIASSPGWLLPVDF